MAQVVNLCEYLESSAGAYADRVALVDDTGVSLTYRELDERSARIAAVLIGRGVQPGDRVGVVAPKSADVVAALFGIMKAGAAYVPADFTAPIARTQTIMRDCGVVALLLDRAVAEIAGSWPAGHPRPEVLWLDSASSAGQPFGESMESAALRAEPVAPRCAGTDDLAYILYTSGSTGVPKGVCITHRNATSFVEWCSETFCPHVDDRFSSHAPFHFDLSIFDIYVAVRHGATLYLVSESLGKSPRLLAQFIARHRLTIWYSTPSILALLAQPGGLEEADCSALRLVLFAGEVFPVKHLRDVSNRWPHATFYNLYGPTETNVCTFARIPLPVPPDRTSPYPIGEVCSHCRALVLDEPGGRQVPRGTEGLLHIAGPAVFRGYWNRDTPEAFTERHGERWYNTGDVVIQTADEGYLYVGRRDRMVKRHGYRIELGEIERGLYRHPSVREAAAVAVQESTGVRIVAYLVAQPGDRPTIVQLKMFCARELPSYMSPDAFSWIDALPRTSTNKVDYQSLAVVAARLRNPARSVIAS
jgi:amino acid adenylation domain-containing protein